MNKWTQEELDLISNNIEKKPKEIYDLIKEINPERNYSGVYSKIKKLKEVELKPGIILTVGKTSDGMTTTKSINNNLKNIEIIEINEPIEMKLDDIKQISYERKKYNKVDEIGPEFLEVEDSQDIYYVLSSFFIIVLTFMTIFSITNSLLLSIPLLCVLLFNELKNNSMENYLKDLSRLFI